MAGGLNLYGYGNGDPVNYSDPFGLCPPEDTNFGPGCPGFFTNIGEAAGAFLGAIGGGFGGGAAGLAIAAPTGGLAAPLTAPTFAAAGAVEGSLVGAAVGGAIGLGLDVLMSKNVGQMNKEIRTGRTPQGVKRVDKGKVKGEQDHVHFRDGNALNEDGTWKHGGVQLTRAIRDWLTKWDWKLPQ